MRTVFVSKQIHDDGLGVQKKVPLLQPFVFYIVVECPNTWSCFSLQLLPTFFSHKIYIHLFDMSK